MKEFYIEFTIKWEPSSGGVGDCTQSQHIKKILKKKNYK